jgi:hypothetical protein
MTYKVEFLLAEMNNTWRTTVFEVPDRIPTDDTDLIAWWWREFSGFEGYRNVVLVAPYNTQP